jgi:hypothetical protein
LIAKVPLSAMSLSAVARRLTQISIVGGSAETEHTAVAVRPLRIFPARDVTMATEDTTCRITVLNSASVTDPLARMFITFADPSLAFSIGLAARDWRCSGGAAFRTSVMASHLRFAGNPPRRPL